MKKVLAIAFFGGLLLTSCKKDHVCECRTTNSADPNFVYTETVTFPGTTRSDAKSKCDALDQQVNTLTKACELK
jgi:hypothetical protein